MTSSRPSAAELRPVCQPAGLLDRRSGEHWAGRLYMRRVSIHVTRLLIGTPATPNALTAAMLAVGVVAAATATVPAFWAALVAAVGVQAYLLLDCVDGEVARWRRRTSPAGVYLDRFAHYVVEAALVAALGVRADGGWADLGGWTTLGLLGSVFVLLTKAETDLVAVARASAGLAPASDADAAPRHRGLRGLRAAAGRVPLHRIIGAVELSFLLVAAAAVDAVAGEVTGSRFLLTAVVVVAGAVTVGHLLMILTSPRLR